MKAITWDDELSEERKLELTIKLATKIVKLGMAVPSILFLEMHKPFAFLATQTVILASGFLVPFVGFQNLQEYCKLLETRESIEQLITEIETQVGIGSMNNVTAANTEPIEVEKLNANAQG